MSKKSKENTKKQSLVNEAKWIKAVEEVCAELEWKTKVQSGDDHTRIICPLQTSEHFMGALFVISSVANRLALYLSYRIKTSSGKRDAVSEAITEINFGLLGGCLELDIESGEVRYRDGFLVVKSEADVELLRVFVAEALQDALEYYPTIKASAGGRKKSGVKKE